MAIDLWKINGKPRSYNPLPLETFIIGLNMGDYVVRFKAKSPTNAKIRFTNWQITMTIMSEITLTNEFKEYELSFKQPVKQSVYFYDVNSKGDIIIEDIELVQKPLPKLTINGIDGFRSGKWTLHANAKVIDDETLELNATGTNQHSIIEIPVKPNTTYYFDYIRPIGINVAIEERQADLTFIRSLNTNVFTTSKNAGVLRIFCSNWSLGVGKYTFKRPMLNLDTTPAPYEPKRGERMVLPTVKGNLFDGVLETGYYNTTSGVPIVSSAHKRTINYIGVTSGKPLYFVKNTSNSFFVHFYDVNKTYISSRQFTVLSNVLIENMPANTVFVRFHFDDNGSVGVDYSTYYISDKPYAVQLNKKPKRTQIAKQNKPAKAKQNIR